MDQKCKIVSCLMSTCLAFSNVAFAIECNVTGLPSNAPDSRFIVHGDGTVSDLQTGLIWKQCKEGRSTNILPCDSGLDTKQDWKTAFALAKQANTNKFADATNWRLPNVKELLTLVERQCRDPAININIFPNTTIPTTERYWTSTPYANQSTHAWTVHFKEGQAGHVLKKDNSTGFWSFVRLVRTGN